MIENTPRTFTYQQQSLFTLSGLLSDSGQILTLTLKVNTKTFPKFYTKTLTNQTLDNEQRFVFSDVDLLYSWLEEMENVQIDEQKGQITLFIQFTLNKSIQKRQVTIKLQRCLESELQQIRRKIESDMKGSEDVADLQNRVERMWRRGQQNEKIFMKFKEDMEFKMEEMAERINIQNTKMSIIRQDVNNATQHINRLTQMVCPMLNRLNLNTEFVEKFILQDRKIMYVGQQGTWTQIMFKQAFSGQKAQFNMKIVNSKKNNIMIGVTHPRNCHNRSTMKKQKSFVGLTASGILFENISSLSDVSSEKQKHENSKNSQPMKPMQVVKMTVDPGKDRVSWKCSGKSLTEARLGDLKHDELAVVMEFCDPGDAVEIL